MGFLAVRSTFILQLRFKGSRRLVCYNKPPWLVLFVLITSDFKTRKLKSLRLEFTNIE